MVTIVMEDAVGAACNYRGGNSILKQSGVLIEPHNQVSDCIISYFEFMRFRS